MGVRFSVNHFLYVVVSFLEVSGQFSETIHNRNISCFPLIQMRVPQELNVRCESLNNRGHFSVNICMKMFDWPQLRTESNEVLSLLFILYWCKPILTRNVNVDWREWHNFKTNIITKCAQISRIHQNQHILISFTLNEITT